MVLEAADRPDQRIAVRSEHERPVDHLLDADLAERREVLEADRQIVGDPVKVRLQQLVPEVPRRGLGRPRHAALLIGPEHGAAMLLAHVDLAAEIDRVHHLLAVGGKFGNVFGDEIVVLHGEQRHFKPDHAADLARPEPARVDHDVRLHRPLVGDHVPAAIGGLVEFGHPGVAVDFRAAHARRLGIGVGNARWIHMAFERIVERADEVLLVDQRLQFLGLGDGDELLLEPQHLALAFGHLEIIEPVIVGRQHDAAGQMNAAGLAGCFFDLLVEIDRVGLQLGDVRVRVERVHAARRMPGRARGQLIAFEQGDVGPAKLGQVVEH